MRIRYKITLALILLAAGFINAAAQGEAVIITLQGKVLDEFGNPIYNALIVSENEANQYITNPDGSYDFQIRDHSNYITITNPGYHNKIVLISEILDGHNVITMESDAQFEDELVDLVHHKMRKNLLTGSVSYVKSRELQSTPTYRLQEAYMGRILGLGSLERDANPSMFDESIYWSIRGDHSPSSVQAPTLMVDGIRYEGYDGHIFTYFNPREVESVTVIRDAATNALYGILGGNGIISITTRRGQQGEPRITVAYDHGWRGMDTDRYHSFSAFKHAMLRNESCLNDGLKPVFSEQQLKYYYNPAVDGNCEYGNAKYEGPENGIWPSNDYYDQFLKRYQTEDKLYLSIGGGSEYVQYMCNFQWMHTGALFNQPEYSGMNYTMNPGSANYFHVASNLDSKLNYFISATFTLRGDFKIENGLGSCPNDRMRVRYEDMIKHVMVAAPTITSLYAPEGAMVDGRDISYKPIFSENSTMGGQIWGLGYKVNPYAELTHGGKTTKYATFVHMDAKVNLDFDMITPGLGGQLGFSFKGGGDKDIDWTISYTMYKANDPSNTTFKQDGAEYDTNGYSKYYSFCYSYEYFGKLEYMRQFGDHFVQAVAMGNHRELASRDIGGGSYQTIPYRSEIFGLNALYAYKDKYLVNGTLGFSGSDEFPMNNRFFFTPGVGLGWVVSKEDFLKGNGFLTYLKLRGSYGRAARGSFSSYRFAYKDNVTSSTWDQGRMGNPSLEPEFVNGMDAGLDLTLFNCLNFSGSIFKEKMNNAYIDATTYVPTFQGISLSNYPGSNTGKFENHGYELSVEFRKQFTKNFTFWAGASTWFNDNTVLEIGERPNNIDYGSPDAYAQEYYTQGFSRGRICGYEFDVPEGETWRLADGSINPHILFQSQEEIDNCGLDYTQMGTVRPGDFKYKDLTGDGTINYKDQIVYKYSTIPRQYFNAHLGFRFKRFEVSALFYGVSKYYRPIGDAFFLGYLNDGFYCDLHENCWTAERAANGDYIKGPALSMTSTSSHGTNMYNVADGTFLKLKNAEIAYTLPEKLSRKMYAQDIRIALQGQNLVTWDRMPSKYIDPETGYLGVWQPMRVWNIALNVTF